MKSMQTVRVCINRNAPYFALQRRTRVTTEPPPTYHFRSSRSPHVKTSAGGARGRGTDSSTFLNVNFFFFFVNSTVDIRIFRNSRRSRIRLVVRLYFRNSSGRIIRRNRVRGGIIVIYRRKRNYFVSVSDKSKRDTSLKSHKNQRAPWGLPSAVVVFHLSRARFLGDRMIL